MSARKVIAWTMKSLGAFDPTRETEEVLVTLQAAGYRILAPDALDPVTLERAAEVAESHIAEPGLSDNPAYVHFSPADAMSKKIAAAIRSLKQEGGRDA